MQRARKTNKHILIGFSNCITAFGLENLIINNKQQVKNHKIQMVRVVQSGFVALFCFSTYCKLDLASAHDVV